MNQWKGPVAKPLMDLLPRRGIVVVLGSEGSGKSSLAYGALETMHLAEETRPMHVFGFPPEKVKHLPDWLTPWTDIELPEDTIVLTDEAYLVYYARETQSDPNKFADRFAGLVRQKGILCVYVSQAARKLELGLVSSARTLLVKQPSLLQMRLDRGPMRDILRSAAGKFAALERQDPIVPQEVFDKIQENTDVHPNCALSTYVLSHSFEGMISPSNIPPSFWSEELSRAWQGIALSSDSAGGGAVPVNGKRAPIGCTEFIDKGGGLSELCPDMAVGTCTCHGNSVCLTHAPAHNIARSG